MRATLEDLFEDSGHAEVVDSICKPYPSRVIATVMGAPLEDAGRLWGWSNWIQRQFGMKVLEERPQIEQAVSEFYDWAAELLNRRRHDPGDDLISTLIAARFEGDRLDDDELINLVLNVLVGGVDTTQSQLAHALRLFAEHPDQWEQLQREPERTAQAVEEVLRYEPITPFTARIALEEVTYRDVTFPEGTVVLVCAHTGNRDPATYENPDAFDITADRGSPKPLTFGAGPHYCLGANLARAELQEALAFLAPRLTDLKLDGDPEFGSIDGIYGLDALPIRWSPAATG
jgi:cytochrome P450